MLRFIIHFKVVHGVIRVTPVIIFIIIMLKCIILVQILVSLIADIAI